MRPLGKLNRDAKLSEKPRYFRLVPGAVQHRDLDVINGSLPRRAHALVIEWASLHKDELMKNWERCQVPARTVPIDPLE